MRGYAENIESTATRPVTSGSRTVALGQSSQATADASLALGQAAQATADFAVSIGLNSTASGLRSIAIGSNSVTSSAINSTAIGSNSGYTGSQAVTGAGAMALGGSYASGTDSFAAAIANNTSSYGATGANGIAIGRQAKVTGTNSLSLGYLSVASGATSTVLGGLQSQATGDYSVALGHNAKAAQYGKYAYASGVFEAVGDAQYGKIVLRAASTTTTAVILTSDAGAASTTNQLIVATNQAMTFFGILIAKQSASNNMASYKVSGAISNNAGTMALADVTVEKIVDTIGLTTEPTFTADSTNKALAITSGAKLTTTIKWSCNVDTVEVIFA
jgi:hypothetical protein